MVYLTRHHGNERSAHSLLDGMPIDGLLNPDQAVRVMRAAGYNAGLMQRDIGDIHALLLPAILLLKNGDACVLVRRLDTPRGQSPLCEIVMPGQEFHICKATEAELDRNTWASRWWPRRCPSRPGAPAASRRCSIPTATGCGARCAASFRTTARRCWPRCSATC